jgi:hypothetical protein
MLLAVKNDTKISYQMSVIVYQSALRPIRLDLNVLKNNFFQEISGGSEGRE